MQDLLQRLRTNEAALQMQLENAKGNNQRYRKEADSILLTQTYLHELERLKSEASKSLPLIDMEVQMYLNKNLERLKEVVDSVLQKVRSMERYRVKFTPRPVGTDFALDITLYSENDPYQTEIDPELCPGKFVKQLFGLILQATSAIMMGHTYMFWDETLSNAKYSSLEDMKDILLAFIDANVGLYIVDQKPEMYASLPRIEVSMESFLPPNNKYTVMNITDITEVQPNESN